ncbi:MAG TPA: hypothetical protein VJX67_27405 [Blastocatellia bacterium]|nr:hypothetical protein [Blastocatellia bacterium]
MTTSAVGKPSPLQVANLTIWFANGKLMAQCKINMAKSDCTVWHSSVEQLELDKAALAIRVSRIQDVLTSDYSTVLTNMADPLAKPKTGMEEQAFDVCMEGVVSEGSTLFTELSDQGLRSILEHITAMPDGSVLTIDTDKAFLPWEILYPANYNKDWPASYKHQHRYDLQRFWGYRFIIDYTLLPSDEEGWCPPIEDHSKGDPYVSLNLNATIDESFASLPFKPIQFHRDFFNEQLRGEGGELMERAEEIKESLLSAKNSATLIYLFCHGSSALPFADQAYERLQLDNNVTIEPGFLESDNVFLRGPIVVLNACSSGLMSPLSFSSFHTQFRKKRALGLIGTTIQMPATFAAAFGRKLIEAYIGHIPIGVALYKLRRELVVEKCNPLALFYSLQCPFHVTAPSGVVGNA